MSEFLGIDIKTLDDWVFQFFKLDLSAKSWKPQGWNIVETPLGKDANGSEANRDWHN